MVRSYVPPIGLVSANTSREGFFEKYFEGRYSRVIGEEIVVYRGRVI